MVMETLKAPIFEVMPPYNPSEGEIEGILKGIKNILCEKLNKNITSFTRLGIGQNINYKVFLLKIRIYPNIC